MGRHGRILVAVNRAAEQLVVSAKWLGFVENMIGEIGEVLDICRIRVIKNHVGDDGDILASQIYQWLDKDIDIPVDEPALKNLSYRHFGFGTWLKRFEKGEIFSGRVYDMSGPGAKWLKARKIKYITCAPIMVDNHCWGSIGFEDWYNESPLPAVDVAALETAARLIGAAIHRDNIEKDLNAKRTQLAHAGRLTAMGEMASGMAHEINQPLTVINLSADVCTAYFKKNEPDAPEAEAAEDVRLQVKKIARIVDKMRVFSRGSSGEMKFLNLAYPLEDALVFFRTQFREYNIELQEDISGDLPDVRTDSQKLEQIIVNFLINARYAVDKKAEKEDGFRKKIEVRLYQVSLSPEQIISFGDQSDSFSGQAIVVEVKDNGIGMDETTKSRCLDPFFSTKEVGEGTGLGLSVSHGLVRELGFYLDIESRPNKGSIFRVFIPVIQGENRV